MALFTDDTVSTIEDLCKHDSSILQVAGVEGIDLTSKLALAQESIGVSLTAMLRQFDRTGYTTSSSSGLNISQIVVTPPLRLWHTLESLSMTYRDAYGSQLNDRYQGKWQEYVSLARWAKEALLLTGLGIVWNPVRQATPPDLTMIPGDQPSTTYYVTMTWVNPVGEEGAPAVWKTLTVEAGYTLSVIPKDSPTNAIGWNVYVGTNATNMTQQNPVLQNIGESWAFVMPALVPGKAPTNGQEPNYIQPLGRLLGRG